jgi:hypothetical protein
MKSTIVEHLEPGFEPVALFELMEREAGNSILQLPGWRKLLSGRPPSHAKKQIGG